MKNTNRGFDSFERERWWALRVAPIMGVLGLCMGMYIFFTGRMAQPGIVAGAGVLAFYMAMISFLVFFAALAGIMKERKEKKKTSLAE